MPASIPKRATANRKTPALLLATSSARGDPLAVRERFRCGQEGSVRWSILSEMVAPSAGLSRRAKRAVSVLWLLR